MPTDRSAPGLLRAVGLLADGPVVWGRPVPARGPGLFVVELPEPRPTAPIELTRVGKWLERVEGLRLDGERPTSRALAARLAAFWLPSEPVLYVGATPSSIGARVRALRETVLGERRPHAGGHWLHTLRGLETARIWWAQTDAVEEYEDALLAAFADGVAPADRAALPDREVVLPFANLRTPTGGRKRTGLSGSLVPEPAAPPAPPTRIVQLPDGDAEGARGEPPAPRSRVARPAPARRMPPPAAPDAAVEPNPRTAPARPGIGAVRLTADGAARLRAELDQLVAVRRPEVIARIRAAKELGDLKENADYTAAREEQSFLEGRIQALEAQLRDAVVVEPRSAGDRIDLGSTVEVEVDGETLTYTLVGSAEADPTTGRISVVSPVGRALVGREPGDEVAVRTPRGEARYRVVAVR